MKEKKREGEEKTDELEELLFRSEDFVCYLTVEGRVLRANDALLSLLGDKIVGHLFSDYLYAEERPKLREALEELNAGYLQANLEVALTSRAGKRRWTLWRALMMEEKGVIFLLGRDLTPLREQQEQLRVSFAALESAASAIMLTNREGEISWVNPAFMRLTGYGTEEVLGKTPRILQSDSTGEETYRAIRKQLEAGLIWSGEITNLRADGEPFTVEETIAPVRDPAGQVTHYVSVMQDVTERKEREWLLQANEAFLRREIDLARKVQESLVPATLPSIPGYDVAARAIPAHGVSGDLYDWMEKPDGTLVLTVADIAGKGIPAAMLASSLKTAIRAQVVGASDPGTVLSRANHSLYEELVSADMFVTCAVLFVEPGSGRVLYANAGHTPAFLIEPENAPKRMLPQAPPLGVLPDLEIEGSTIQLKAGSRLFLYSDGVTEAENHEGEQFGIHRVEELLGKGVLESSEGLVTRILGGVSAFCGDMPVSDDLTLLTIRKGESTTYLNLPAEVMALDTVLDQIEANSHGSSPGFVERSQLVASELVSNIVKHGYRGQEGELRIALTLGSERMILEVWEEAQIYEGPLPGDLEPPGEPVMEELSEGGYGLYLLDSLCREFEYLPRTPEGNYWRCVYESREE